MTRFRTALVAVGGIVILALAALASPAQSQVVARYPLPSEVKLDVFQYATGDHRLSVVCANDEVENTAPVYNLVVDRPFQYRIEPRWTGGSEALDVIFEVHVGLDLTGQVNRSTSRWTVNDSNDSDGDNQWSQLTHLGSQSGNREMAQIGQHVTFGRGNLLHPMIGGPVKYDFRVDFQLGKQNGPKRVCEAEVRVWRAGDPNAPGA